MNAVLALGLLGMASYTDWKAYRIYNRHVLTGLLAGLIYHAWTAGWAGAAASLGACLAGGALLFPAWLLGAVGGGDVKLLAALGALLGLPILIQTALWLGVYSLVWALALIIWKKRVRVFLRWTRDFLKYMVFRIVFWDGRTRDQPLIEDGIKIRFAFVISAAVLSALISEGAGVIARFT